MMVYSVAPVSSAVELHSHLLLFTSDVSKIGAADSRAFAILVGELRTRNHGKLELSSGEGTLYQIAANAHTLASGCYVTVQEPPTKVFGQTAGREAGTELCFACYCAALYQGSRVTPSDLCCRLLLCSCRRHLASGAPVHHQELFWLLFQCLWICYQGKKLIQCFTDMRERGKADEVVTFKITVQISKVYVFFCAHL
jgi:hypothetical protein